MSRYAAHPRNLTRSIPQRYYYVPAATLRPPTVTEKRMPTLLLTN